MTTLCIRPSPSDDQCTLYDRVSKLLDSFEWSDVTFIVGSQVIKAHKLILAISSPVFKVMLYGPMAEQTEIIISDIEPQVFQLLLDFVYKDKVVINTLENACGLLYASKKYMLPHLSDMCIKYINKSTSITNVMSIYNFSDWIQEETLLKYSLSLICKHANVVLNKYYHHVTDSCLIRILQESSMNISEKELIHVAWIWSHNECLERGLCPTNENKRQLLLKSNIFNHLRFLTLTKEDLQYLEELDMLTTKEINHIEHMKDQSTIREKSTDNFILNLNKICRKPLGQEWSLCRRPVIRNVSPLVISNVSQSVKVRFKCHKTVFIGSLLVPSRQSADAFRKESVINSYLENIMLTLQTTNDKEDDNVCVLFNKIVDYNKTILIEFPKPVIVNEDEWCTLTICWPGSKSQLLRYPLCIRATTTYSCDQIFTFDDNFPYGSFVEGLMFCV